MQFLIERVVPIVGWPKSVYSDNGTHFTGSIIRKMWDDHGVSHFTAAISHPQSVGLSERYVQMAMGRIRLRCIEMGTSQNWGLLVKDAIIDINTQCVRVHGHTPSEILLGFNPVTSRKPIIDSEDEPGLESTHDNNNWASDENILAANEDTIHFYTDLRDERGETASQRQARQQDRILTRATPGFKGLRPGDLVLVRDIQLANQKGKKLEPRWTTPRILEKVSKSGVSGHIRQLHDPPGRTKRYHIDDLIPYIARNPGPELFNTHSITPAIEYTRDSLGDIQGTWINGQWAFDLSDVGGRRS